MKYTKIKNDSVYFRLSGEDSWHPISDIQGNDILKLLEYCFEDDFELVEYNSDLIKNEAHNIIYKSIYNKFSEIISEKKNIIDENSLRYKEIIDKYRD